VLDGIPGLSDIPLVGRLFAHTRRETQEPDIVLTLTPRIVRILYPTGQDLRPFRVGRAGAGGAGGVIDLPVILDTAPPLAPPPQQQPQPQPQPQPGTAPPADAPLPPATPIQPPQPAPAPPPR